MEYPEAGIVHFTQGQAIEKVSLKGLELSLLASGDGTEIIHHRLTAGSRWVIGPEEGWNALEHLFVLSGCLVWQSPAGEKIIKTGDSISAVPVKKDAFFIAKTNTEFLYVSSRPVFHHYSQTVQQMMELTVSVEEKDGYTADHCQRIKDLSMLVGDKLGLLPNQMYELNLGAFLHDIGKVKVPENILGKPGSLTPEEWSIMKLHTVFGREMLQQSPIPNLVSAAAIVEQHHERIDGSGYPHGLRGSEILVGSLIVAVVDSFDAMTTDRVYKKGRSKEEALAEIEKGRDSLYRSDVVDAFFSII